MATNNLPQPPRSKGGQVDPLELKRWFDSIWMFLAKATGVAWSAIGFSGSKLSDIEIRPHSGLQGLEAVGVHPHEAITGRDGVNVHPHQSMSARDAANQHHAKAINFSVTAVTAAYTVVSTDFLVAADASSGDFSVTLFTAVGFSGRVLDIKNVGSTGMVTADGDGTETIDGSLTFALSPFETITLVSDGTNWWII